MAKTITCECGYVVRGADDDELVRNAEDHVTREHPDMAGTITRDEFLAMAQED